MKKRLLCGILLIALGAGVYFYPTWSAVRAKHQQEQVIRQFQSEGSISDMQQEQEAENEDTVWTETVLEQSKAYNETLFETEQAAFRDAEAVKVVPDFFPDAREPIGILSIPAMDCTLPLYVGATDAHLNLGTAVLGGTSLPVGGKNTNSVIAAHRGWKNGKYFKEIEKLRPGNAVFVENPWETLCYKVEACEVIAPTDSERLKIQEGRDMLTLITCHPYRSHGASRYVVYCVRTDSGQGSFTVTESGNEKREEQPIEDASTPDIQRELWCRRIGMCLILGCICMACVQTGKHLRKKQRRKKA